MTSRPTWWLLSSTWEMRNRFVTWPSPPRVSIPRPTRWFSAPAVRTSRTCWNRILPNIPLSSWRMFHSNIWQVIIDLIQDFLWYLHWMISAILEFMYAGEVNVAQVRAVAMFWIIPHLCWSLIGSVARFLEDCWEVENQRFGWRRTREGWCHVINQYLFVTIVLSIIFKYHYNDFNSLNILKIMYLLVFQTYVIWLQMEACHVKACAELLFIA